MKTKYEKLLDISRTYYTKTSNLRASIFKCHYCGGDD